MILPFFWLYFTLALICASVDILFHRPFSKCTLTANLACDGLRLLAHKDDPRNIVSMTFCKTGIGGLHIDEECVGSVDWWEDVDGIVPIISAPPVQL